jgi:hypothetical protein
VRKAGERSLLESARPPGISCCKAHTAVDRRTLSGIGQSGEPRCRIKADIQATVSLAASVGIGHNRLVAKIASEFAKSDGLTVVPTERALGFLGTQPVGVLAGSVSRPCPSLRASASAPWRICAACPWSSSRPWSLYETAGLPNKPAGLIGLGISDLGTLQPVQQDLFDGGPNRTLDNARDRRLNATLDRINARFGPGALRRGADRRSQPGGGPTSVHEQHFNNHVLDEQQMTAVFVVNDDSDPGASQSCLFRHTP